MRGTAAATLILLSGLAQAMDLMDAYRQARSHDPAMLAADEARQAGQEKAVQGDALLRPQVTLRAGVNRVDRHNSGYTSGDNSGDTSATLPSLSATSGSGTTRQASLQLTQPIYDAAATASRAQHHQQTALAQTEFDHARQALGQRVAQTYFGVLLAQETLRVVLAEKTAVALQRDRAQARFEVGRGNVTDIEETRARYDLTRANEISVRGTLALRQAQFRETIGLPAEGLAALSPGVVPLAPEPDSLETWLTKDEENSTIVRVQRSQLAIATAEIDKHRLAGRPTLNLVASVTTQAQSSGFTPPGASNPGRGGVIGLELSIPLYAGGALDSRQREALARQRQAEQELAAARRDTRLQVQEEYLTVQTSLGRIAALQQSVVSARSALDATLAGQDVGNRTVLDVLDMQQRWFAAERDLLQARYDYLLGWVRLAAAAGELDESVLGQINAGLATH